MLKSTAKYLEHAIESSFLNEDKWEEEIATSYEFLSYLLKWIRQDSVNYHRLVGEILNDHPSLLEEVTFFFI